MKSQIVFILLLLASGSLFAQGNFTVKHYSMNDGLAYSLNKDIIQDSKGYIWLATWNGIDKFDGYTFRNFKSYPHDKVKLPNNRIEGLYINSQDNFWVRTYGQQLFLFNRETESFEDVFEKNQHPLIQWVKCLENGITWAVSESSDLYRIDEENYLKPEGIRFFGRANYPYLGKTIYDIFLDSDGDEWILSDKGITIEGRKKIRNNMPFQFIVEMEGEIFLASQNGYLAAYTSTGNLVTVNISLDFDRINRLKKIDNERIAIITPDRIVIYNTKKKTIAHFSPPKGEEFIASEKLFYDSQGAIWSFASGGKVIHYDTRKDKCTVLNYPELPDKKLQPGFAFFFYEDTSGEMWILLREGIMCTYNRKKEQLEVAYYYDFSGNRNCYAVSARNYIVDTHHNLWITTRDGFDQLSFNKAASERMLTSSGEEVRAIFQDTYDRLWLGVKNGKIELYDKTYRYIGNLTAQGKVVANSDATFGANIYCFYQDSKGTIWMGSRDKGLFVLHPENEHYYRISQYKPTDDPYSISSLSVYDVLEDSKGRIWIGAYGGGLNLVEQSDTEKFRFIHAGNRLRNYPIEQGDRVRCIYQSKKGTMMVGTSNGLVTFSSQSDSPEKITFFHNFCKPDRSDCLSNSDVLHICQDRTGAIYISTFSGGVDVTSDSPELLSEAISFKNINKTNGLISDLSLSVVEDKKGFIWIASIHALSKYTPSTGKFEHFNQDNLGMSFKISEATPMIDHENNLIFGTTNGVLRILSEQIEYSTFVPPIVFTGIRIQQKGNKDSNEIKQISGSVSISPDQRNMTIQFAALDYTNTEAINYAYRLKDNKENDWIYIGKNRSVDFINLPAGEHVFQVKSTNGDGVWMENVMSLHIIVKPAFWETGFAWLVYSMGFILLALLVAFIITYILNLRKRVDFEQELTNLKLKFFTDISHELRTPLTLIASPVEEVISTEKLSETGKENMQTVKHNADRMLKLINQILDFRKIQNNKMKVYLEQIDIQPVIEKIFQNFSGMAQQMQIKYVYQSDDKNKIIYTDTDKVEKILFNLLSNAFKYTPKGRNITLITKIEDDHFLIQVKDEGAGFDMQKIDFLFKRFETNNKANPTISSGIGLSLVKELVNLLHGKIDVESIIGVGSTFSVRLPMKYEVFAADHNVELILNDADKPVEEEGEIIEQADKDTTILIIEDNDELRHFIKKILVPFYHVLEAPNGKIGLELTMEVFPDIVISDIMMPEMDGIEYLNKMKTNHEISHIPVILLTAKSSIDDQIKGMEYGADDYVTKPFSSTYLKAKIAALIKQRKQLRNYYLSKEENVKIQIQPAETWEPSVPKITSYDDEFICKVIKKIEDNIDNTDFKIDTIVESLSMSRTVFYRKIKAIMGLSPIDFVKKMRIKRAIQLLDTNQFTIAEVAYQSGFTTPQYLSRVFKEITGCSPTEYLQKKQSNK